MSQIIFKKPITLVYFLKTVYNYTFLKAKNKKIFF